MSRTPTVESSIRNCAWIPILAILSPAALCAAAQPEWSGDGGCRIIVTVAPVKLVNRNRDEMVASVHVDFEKLQREFGIAGVADPATIQVQKFNPQTGKPERFPVFETQRTPFDRPCRFDDTIAREDLPDRAESASSKPDGRVSPTPRARAARLFNREMDSDRGYIVWSHEQRGSETAHYAVYWQTRTAKSEIGPGPMPWLGDVDVYRLPDAQSLAAFSHLNMSAGDLDGDGLFDIAAGAEKGDVMVFFNRGALGHPRFNGCRLPRDQEGPIDCGWYSAPVVHDWDSDGKADLLCGTSHNVILWWKNAGGGDVPAFEYRGFVQADGIRLEVPQHPVVEDHAGIFKVDYYNQPSVCDWNADGLPDLLTGGYTTGRIFLYLCERRDDEGVPVLRYAGEVEASGKPIDTTWGAAPLAFDFDNDGLLELITGSWNFQGPVLPDTYFLYFENTGDRKSPRFERRPFPRTGDFPNGTIARPAAVDWNSDGLTDLLMADHSGEARCALNTGSKESPNWDFANAIRLTAPWAFVYVNLLAGYDAPPESPSSSGPMTEALFLSGSRFEVLAGSPHLPRIADRGLALTAGEPIEHPSPPYGDAYNWNIPADWDNDGLVDILSCTFQGNVYFHRNTGSASRPEFDSGTPFTLTSGEMLKVGPPVFEDKSQVKDFTELQGSRALCLAADFDGDAVKDLAVTETYGNIWIFRNTESGSARALAPGIKAVTMPSRSDIDCIDWNEDGRTDIITGLPQQNPGTVYLNESAPGHLKFSEAIHPFDLPYVFWGAKFFATDWNRDGDTDFLIRSEFYLFWAEKSFLQYGYRDATIVRAEATPR